MILLRTEAGIGHSNNAEGIVMVLFVHGWKNNAAHDNENVEMFRDMEVIDPRRSLGRDRRRAPQNLKQDQGF